MRTPAILVLLCVLSSSALRVSLAPLRRPAAPAARRIGCDIVCGWGPDPIWTPNSIVTIDDAAQGLKAITIAPPDGVADGFTTPGQYVQIRQPGAEKAGFFAIASAPGADGAFEFLIKEQPPSDWSPGTGWLTGAPAGTALEMSQVMGGGFKLKEVRDDVSSVLLFAAGSGISPLRSVIESELLSGLDATLFYGAQTPAQMAYESKFKEWAARGVNVTPVISRPDGTGWKGATGYVQDVAKAGGIGDPSKTAVLLCGMKGMAEGVKAVCAEAGIDESRVLANF